MAARSNEFGYANYEDRSSSTDSGLRMKESPDAI